MSPKKEPKKSVVERYGLLAGALAAIFGLIFLLFPDIKPRETPDVDVEISAIEIEQDLAYETYLSRQGLTPPKDFTCKELKANGMLIKPTFELTGLKGEDLQVRWSMYRADSRRLAPEDWYPEKVLNPIPEYTPPAQKDIWIFEHWIPYPMADGEFYVHLELFMKENNGLRSLGYKDTEPFPVELFPECAGPIPDPPFPPDALTPPS